MTISRKSIYTIEQNHNFLECLAKGILERVNNDLITLSNTEIYLPNKRTCNQLKQEFVNLSENNCSLLPRIKSIGMEDEEELEIRLLNKTNELIEIPNEIGKYERLFLVSNIIKNFKHQDYDFTTISTKQAIILANSLIELLDDCHRYQTNNLEGLSNIFTEELSTHKQVSIDFLEFIFKEYPKFLKNKNLVDPIEKRNFITEALTTIYSHKKTVNHVFIAGSTGTLPLTRNLIKAIYNLPFGEVIIPYIDKDSPESDWLNIGKNENELNHQYAVKNLLDFMELNRNDVKLFHSANDKKTYNFIPRKAMQNSTLCANWKQINIENHTDNLQNIQIAELENSTQEAKIIALILKESIYQNKKCALVTDNKKLITYTESFLQQFGETLDDSIGKKYSSTVEGIFALNIAELISENFKTNTLIDTLKSPVVSHDTPQESAKFKLNLNKLEKNIARKYGLRSFQSLIHFIKNKADFNDEEKLFLSQYINSLEEIEKDTASNFSLEYKKIFLIFENIISIFSNSNARDILHPELLEAIDYLKEKTPNERIPVKEFYDIISCIINKITIHPLNFENPKISVLAPVEARLLYFDRVIIADTNLGSFPKNNFSQWLNNPMKKDFGLPNEELNLSLSAHDFASLIQCEEVFITRSNYDNSEPTTPSPFLTRLKSFLDIKNIDHKLNDIYLNTLNHLEEKDFKHKEFSRPMPTPPAESRVNYISATAIEKTIKNPYSFYAKEILNLRKLEDLETPTERREFGKFVHSSLEDFSNHHLLQQDKISLDKLNNIFKNNYEEHNKNNNAEPFWILETQQISPWITKQEKEDAENLRSRKSEIKGLCEIHGLIISAIADRFDIDKQGNLHVVDYKTGRSPSENEVRNLQSPQLPIELLMALHDGFKENKLSKNDFREIGSAFYYNISLSSSGPSITKIDIIHKEENLLEVIDFELKNLSESLKDATSPFLAYPHKDMIPEYDDYFLLARYEK